MTTQTLTRLPQAKCRGLNPEIFFGHDHTEALRLCASCPERIECKTLHINEPSGVFGGTTPADRGFGRQQRSTGGCRSEVMQLLGQSPNCWFRREFIEICLPEYTKDNVLQALRRLKRSQSIIKRTVGDFTEFKAA